MGYREIQNVDEAKARLVRALLCVTLAAGIAAFGLVLYECWAEGPQTASRKASLFAILILAITGGIFMLLVPGAKKQLEITWAAKEQKDT